MEQRIRALWDRKDFAGAVTAALQGYGPEILGVLTAVARREEDAREAFAQFGEDLWKGIAGFEWRSSFRTWAYGIAHNALVRLRMSENKRANRHVPLSQAWEATQMPEEVRERTRPYLRTDVKDEFTKLRASLDPDDQIVLILRLDKRMSWLDIAEIVGDEAARADAQALKRESARLRKRYEKLKDEIRDRAIALGLLDDEPKG